MQQPINDYQSPTEMMTQAAVAHALNGQWSDATQANRKLIALNPLDVEAHNRLGKALAASGNIQDAIAAYSRVIELDPYNKIAQRYLTRLEAAGKDGNLTEISGAAIEMARVSGSTTGSAIVTRLVRTAGPDVTGGSAVGDQLKLEPSPAGIRVSTTNGKYLGVVNPKLSVRLARLVMKGSRYDAFVAHVTDDDFRVNIVESFKHPSMMNVISFPAQYVEHDEPITEIDRYDLSEAGAVTGLQDGSQLMEVEDDESVASADGRTMSMLSGSMDSPDL
ncbi:MAG: tetratricopeptide repeat protein [Chloroflexi bacterium]|nr:tetratricopeptide repeat protein [Chloroflexota bacterium]